MYEMFKFNALEKDKQTFSPIHFIFKKIVKI